MTAAERAKAQATCGENKECLFDFAVTGMTNYKRQNTASNYAIVAILRLLITTYLNVQLPGCRVNAPVCTGCHAEQVFANTDMHENPRHVVI